MNKNLRYSTILVLIAIFFLVSTSIYNISKVPLISDNQHHFFISERLASGIPPHLSQFEIKTIFPDILNGLAIRIGESMGLSAIIASRICSIFSMILALLVLGYLFEKYYNNNYVSISALISIFIFTGYICHVYMGSRPKVFILTFFTLYLLFYERQEFILSGVSAGLCFLGYQPLLILTFCFGISAFVNHIPSKAIVRFLFGFFLAILAYFFFLFYHNILYEAYLQAWRFPYLYRLQQAPDVTDKILRIAKSWHMGYGSLVTLPVLIVSGYFFIKSALALKRNKSKADIFLNHLLICTIFLLAISLFELQGYPDTYILIPSLMFFWGMGVQEAYIKYEKQLNKAFASYIFLFIILATGLNTRHKNKILHTSLEEQQQQATLLKNIVQDKTLFVIDCNHLLSFMNRSNWDNYAFFGKPRIGEIICKDSFYMPRTETRPDLPHFILTTKNTFPFCNKKTEEKYDTISVNIFEEDSNPKFFLKIKKNLVY